MASYGMRIPTGGSLFSAYASFCATYTLLQQAFHQFIPIFVQQYVSHWFRSWFSPSPPPPPPDNFTLIIEEITGGMNRNEIFDACQIYLCNKMNDSTNVLKVSRAPNEETMNFKLAKGVKFSETFEGIPLQWSFHRPTSSDNSSSSEQVALSRMSPDSSHNTNQPRSEKSCFSLSFDKQHKKKVSTCYLPFVIEASQEIVREEKALRLYDCVSAVDRYGSLHPGMGRSNHHSVKMTHPFTFDKLAIDPEMKKMILDDLDRFVRRKDFYRRIGKPWKRGYLLYGPPGTGKSSLIAAIANHLKFDIYDLQLEKCGFTSLRDLLLWIPSKSIIVVEDIDRRKGLSKQRNMRQQFDGYDKHGEEKENQKDLAPLLNFVDGLWSCCGDERLIVFTTNHKERLDPALLRPGRMDMHIHMSYLTMTGFEILAYNYLLVSNNHRLFPEIESLLNDVNATPAEVAEELLRSEDVDIALQGVIEFLKSKKSEAEDAAKVETNLVETEKQEDAKEVMGSIENEAPSKKMTGWMLKERKPNPFLGADIADTIRMQKMSNIGGLMQFMPHNSE